jgi:NAD(P)-dependent dehydrogenase (short-subunit alcohol dehydrogenase family)
MELISSFNSEFSAEATFPQQITLCTSFIETVQLYNKNNNIYQLSTLIIQNMKDINQIMPLISIQNFYELLKENIYYKFNNVYVKKLLNYHYNNYVITNNKQHLLIMNNKYNRFYNFANVPDKIANLKTEIDKYIHTKSEYYLGTQSVNYLFGNYKKKYINFVDIYISTRVTFKTEEMYADNSSSQTIIKTPSFYIVIHDILCEDNIANMLINYDNNFAIDLDNTIYCSPKYFINLNRPIKLKFYEIINMKSIKTQNCRIKTLKAPLVPKCYICKKYMETIFYKYESMCLACGIYNYKRKEEIANLKGFKVYISGIRHKIGYASALKLLRSGATVYGSTRSPCAALLNYSKENDFDEFKDRLFIIKCDFINYQEFDRMLEFLETVNLNAIINNACQTTVPSTAYLTALNQLEERVKLSICAPIQSQALVIYNNLSLSSSTDIVLNEFGDIKEYTLDNSWTKKIQHITASEIISANLINLVAPTLIINRLKPTLINPKFIINVTAMEGNFSSKKNEYHAHTNSCKAGLNMLTKTIAEENDPHLMVHSIDPGFVSGVIKGDNIYPIKMEDGGARVVFPIISYFNGHKVVPVNMKDYREQPW